jgi:branched-chain amino acid transport system permease protein
MTSSTHGGQRSAAGALPGTAGTLLLAAGFLLLVAFPFFRPPLFFTSLLFSIFMFIALAESWNITGGYLGYVSFAHVSFFSVGAYTTAVLLKYVGLSPFLTAIPGGLLAALLALAIGTPVLRLKDAYFSISTLLFTIILQLIFMNWEFVGGSTGMWYVLMDIDIHTNNTIFYLVMLAVAIATTLTARHIEFSKLGIGLVTIREDEDVARTLGINTPLLKLKAFAISAFFAGVVGGVFGFYSSFVHPESTFSIDISLLIILMAFFGGPFSWKGPLWGAITLSIVNQVLITFVGAEVARVLYGLLLIVVIIFMPNGFIEAIRDARTRRGASPG